jgi:hypothetical protein
MQTARVDIERVRVAAERDAYALLEREERAAIGRYAPQDVATKRRALLANALLLTETMAPEAHDAAREVLSALGVDDRVELFQSSGHGIDTARLVLDGGPIGVEFLGGYLDRLDRGGLLAVLGHEIGHCLAHRRHPVFGPALAACVSATTPARRAYSMAAELTADRFGLLACRDLDAVLRLEIQMSAGRSARSIRFDTQAYLEQCRAVAEETLAAGGMAMGGSHPEHYVRGYAEWLFSETDLYRSITGTGPASRSIDEVDATLVKLLGIERISAESTIAEPSPRRLEETPPHTAPEESAASLATETLRRTVEALANVVGAAVPSRRRDPIGSSENKRPVDEDEPDPLGDERRDLIARFEELERRSKGN